MDKNYVTDILKSKLCVKCDIARRNRLLKFLMAGEIKLDH